MGGISGKFLPNKNYDKYQNNIQKQTEEKGISNSENYNYRIVTKNNVELKPKGGIGITDSKEFEEIIIESAGLDLTTFEE
jgi:hypothetical protein